MNSAAQRTVLVAILALLGLTSTPTGMATATPEPPIDGHRHDRFVTRPTEAVREFQAFTLSFDTDEDGIALGVPDWVAYELRRDPSPGSGSHPRPSRWSTDPELHRRRIAPDDSSYRNSGYSRGHLCMKSHAGRMGATADRETHTVLNACPQMQAMNGGIWLAIENLTGQWANDHGVIWIVTGPVFTAEPKTWIGDPGEVPVAVPDAFFKLAIRHDGANVHVLAFLVPMYGDRNHSRSSADATPYLTSVDIIEALTGLDFLTSLPDAEEAAIERRIATTLWTPPPAGAAAPIASRPASGPASGPASETTPPTEADTSLRPGRDASTEDLAAATELVSRGWRYVMPRPKSSRAAWGNRDGRTTWWLGYWTNTSTGRSSTTRPTEADGFQGDGIKPDWRRGGSPGRPSDLEWLCSTSGGPPSR